MIINCLVSKQASLITCIVTKQTSNLVFHPLKIIAQTYIIHLCRENILFSVSFPSYCLVPHFKYVCLFVSRRVLPDRHVRICRDPQGCNSPLWPPLRGAYINRRYFWNWCIWSTKQITEIIHLWWGETNYHSEVPRWRGTPLNPLLGVTVTPLILDAVLKTKSCVSHWIFYFFLK